MVIGHCIALDFIASAVVGGTSDYITLCGCNSLACSAFGGTHSPVQVQSGASSRAKHGGAYFSAVRGSIKDLIAVPGWDEVQEC